MNTSTAAVVEPPPYLSIRSLSKHFGEFTALDDISLDIEEGEFVCFLGPSGCGKTTLLRAIAGLDIQSQGEIHQAGGDISAQPPERRDFGIVFQSYALFPNLSIEKNIAFGLENRGLSRGQIHQRVDELLQLVGLAEQSKKYPAQLSGGQQQRIALARALAPSPGLLLLDEPLSALDAKVRGHLRQEIRSLQQRLGITTIMVTHDQEEALTMADRIVVMNHGVIEQVGTPREIYAQPASAFVADFIGTMNFLKAEVIAEGQVSVGGRQLSCDTGGAVIGSRVTLAVRPESFELCAEGAGDNCIDVTVAAVEFLGAFVRAELDLAADGQRSMADFPVNRIRELALDEGASLSLHLPSDEIRLYPGADHV